jgi:hypothetical protein
MGSETTHETTHPMGLPAPKPTIDTCNACGKLFPRTSMRLCSQCVHVPEHRFALVRDYLVENDGAPVAEIARATGVSSSDVRRFTEGGRLVEVTSGLDHCTCGGVGERCRHCRAKLSSSFRRVEQEMRAELAERGLDGRGGASGRPAHDDGGRTSYVRRIRRLGDSD